MTKLRLIQSGAGAFGSHWLTNASTSSPDFDLVALVDTSPAVLQAAAAKHNIPASNCFPTLEAALDAVEADAVLSVTPPAVHPIQARLAFDHGLHFMTEKPIADTIEHGRDMVRWAHEAGKQLVVSQNYRYCNPIETLRQQLQSGVLGTFGHGNLEFFIPSDFRGTFRETMEYVLVMDMAVHHFDLIRYVTGSNITRVTSHTFRTPWSRFRHHAAAHILLELEGGRAFSYCGDWDGYGRSTTWNGDWRLQCAEGSLHLEQDTVSLARCVLWGKNQQSTPVPLVDLHLKAQAATLNSFAEAIRTGTPSPLSGADNLYSFAAVCAAVISSRENRAVEIAELLG